MVVVRLVVILWSALKAIVINNAALIQHTSRRREASTHILLLRISPNSAETWPLAICYDVALCSTRRTHAVNVGSMNARMKSDLYVSLAFEILAKEMHPSCFFADWLFTLNVCHEERQFRCKLMLSK